jgi:hypothetical protein
LDTEISNQTPIILMDILVAQCGSVGPVSVGSGFEYQVNHECFTCFVLQVRVEIRQLAAKLLMKCTASFNSRQNVSTSSILFFSPGFETVQNSISIWLYKSTSLRLSVYHLFLGRFCTTFAPLVSRHQ